jgi:glycosyltransferase A (GT-A) superfamily protein (DUF2064 family)
VADGGFWLVGLRRSNHLAGLFDGVRWSGPNALGDTLANLKRCKIGFTSTLVDVDDGQSYERAGRAGSRVTLFPGDRRYHASASAPKIVL